VILKVSRHTEYSDYYTIEFADVRYSEKRKLNTYVAILDTNYEN